MICLPLASWRRRAPAGKTLFQGGDSRSGVFGVTLPPRRTVPEGSPYSRGPSLRMEPVPQRLFSMASRGGSGKPIRPCRHRLALLLGPASTSNRGGSRAASSRGPWSSAELATRPVRKGPPKPKENGPDSRKTRTSNHRIPGTGRRRIRRQFAIKR